MGSTSRLAALPAALALVTGCGASVTDSDAPAPSRSAPEAGGEFCTAVQINNDAVRPLTGLSGGAEAREDLPDLVAEVRRTGAVLLATAPTEIRTDVERTVEATDLRLAALEAAGGDPVLAARDPELSRRLDVPELAAARQRVRKYVAENCGAG